MGKKCTSSEIHLFGRQNSVLFGAKKSGFYSEKLKYSYGNMQYLFYKRLKKGVLLDPEKRHATFGSCFFEKVSHFTFLQKNTKKA